MPVHSPQPLLLRCALTSPLHLVPLQVPCTCCCPSLVLLLQAVAAAQAELADLKAKYGGLTRQYDEAVHKINLAKQASIRSPAVCWGA